MMATGPRPIGAQEKAPRIHAGPSLSRFRWFHRVRQHIGEISAHRKSTLALQNLVSQTCTAITGRILCRPSVILRGD
jgi:hypothetical protein